VRHFPASPSSGAVRCAGRDGSRPRPRPGAGGKASGGPRQRNCCRSCPARSWGPTDAALATIALARGDIEGAVLAGGAAVQALQTSLHEDASLEIVIPAARALFAGAPPEVQGFVRGFLQSTLSRIAQGTADETIRVRWLTGPVGRELVKLAGPMDTPAPEAAGGTGAGAAGAAPATTLDETERRLLQLLTEGRTNAEIAAELDLAEDDVVQRLTRLFARLGTSSRAEATSLAFRGLAAVGSH
jgi:DNA-binding NarL/FixJ family response regulator